MNGKLCFADRDVDWWSGCGLYERGAKVTLQCERAVLTGSTDSTLVDAKGGVSIMTSGSGDRGIERDHRE